ncbi:unnamed protein product [Closterium sp. Naga37s-1]|nr:unnamed protein product [Closterium sp. Naga37s-1]
MSLLLAPAAAPARRIDYSKWDHLHSSSDEEEEEQEKRKKQGEEGGRSNGGGKGKAQILAAAKAGAFVPQLVGPPWGGLTLEKVRGPKPPSQEKPCRVGDVEERKGEGPERPGAEEDSEKLQLLCRDDMVHYLDVRDAWGVAVCECCFHRAVSQRTQHALVMTTLKAFRSHVQSPQPASIPLAPNRQARGTYEYSLKVPLPEAVAQLNVAADVHVEMKGEMAALICAEAMLLEWMAEPRVGVLMDLGTIRSRLPAIMAATHCPAAKASPAAAPPDALPGVGATAPAAPPAVAAAFASTLVNTNPVVAVFTYRAACILQWARTYGAQLVPATQCCKDSPHGKVRPIRHPLRDLPSLLVRLGAIPKPLDQGRFPLEWEEWPRGDEAAATLPHDPRARFFHLGIVEEANGTAREKGGQGSNAGGKIGTARGKGRDKGKGKREGRSRVHGDDERSEDERLLQQVLTELLPLVQRKFPIVRCTADAEFIVEFAGHVVQPPACAQCKQCLAVYSRRMPFLMVVTNYAYRPATTLFNRFVSIFPPLSPEFERLTVSLGLPAFPASMPGFLRSPVVQARAEKFPVYFLLTVALNCPLPILGITDLMFLHRLRDGEEEDGRLWEEVQMWCLAMLFAWTGGMKLEAEALTDTCKGRQGLSSAHGPEERFFATEKGQELFRRATIPRFCEDMQDENGPSEGARSSNNRSGSCGSNSSSDRRGRKSGIQGSGGVDGMGDEGGEPAYLKAWPGGVNLVACLREMLLGVPCYRPAPPAAPSTPAGGKHVCGAVGCGRVEGGGVKLRSCSGCGKVAYCSRECQKAHWPSHKLTCPGRTSGRDGGSSSGKVRARGLARRVARGVVQ